MLRLAGLHADPGAALADGRALERYRAMIAAQGGDPEAQLPSARHAEIVTAQSGGWLHVLDARAVGVAAWRLGAGRARKEDPVSAAAGIICLAKPGDAVAGRPSRCSNFAAMTPARSTARARRSLARSPSVRNRPSRLTWCLIGSDDTRHSPPRPGVAADGRPWSRHERSVRCRRGQRRAAGQAHRHRLARHRRGARLRLGTSGGRSGPARRGGAAGRARRVPGADSARPRASRAVGPGRRPPGAGVPLAARTCTRAITSQPWCTASGPR